MTATETYRQALERICAETIAPFRAEVDRGGILLSKSLAALKSAGRPGAVSAPETDGLPLL